jgi:hypothetical protein
MHTIQSFVVPSRFLWLYQRLLEVTMFNTKQMILLSRKFTTLPKHSVKHPSPTIYTKGIVLKTRGK